MAPRLPDRYHTHVRLGRDRDVEEWLATDTALDRPVMVRVLSASATEQRAAGFVSSSRAAARVNHPHLTAVYEVGADNGTTFAVTEWNGGVTVADRLRASDALPAHEFLPNAAGLAAGLAALHRAGAVHGAIDPSAIEFSSAHPAKLGAFGRPCADAPSPVSDTRALATALREAVTGAQDESIRPSDVVVGLPPRIDSVLARAEAGDLDSDRLAAALRSIPQPQEPSRASAWSWGWLVTAGVLALAIVLISLAGLAIDVDPDSPFLFPATPAAERAPVVTSAPVSTTAAPEASSLPYRSAVFDPFGEGTENDDALPALSDGNPDTAWSTERYFRPLEVVKAGVGVTFSVSGRPGRLILHGTDGTSFTLLWAPDAPASLDGFSSIASGTILRSGSQLQLPSRDGGVWLVWLTTLPPFEEDVYLAEIHSVEFLP